MAYLDGLEQMGLGGLINENADAQAVPAPAGKAPEKEVPDASKEESAIVYDKRFVCPVCDREFFSKTVRVGKVHTKRFDYDLRPVYDVIDSMKYDVIACPRCGCASAARLFGTFTAGQLRLIRERIGVNFQPVNWEGDIYTYEQAKLRYQLAIANAIAMKAPVSEQAYLCLKAAWIYRGEAEWLAEIDADDPEKIAEDRAMEKELQGRALEGFAEARAKERPPIAGMEDSTLEYLLAALHYSQAHYREAAQIISRILTNKSSTPNLRKRAEELRDLVVEGYKKSQ